LYVLVLTKFQISYNLQFRRVEQNGDLIEVHSFFENCKKEMEFKKKKIENLRIYGKKLDAGLAILQRPEEECLRK